MKRTGKEPRLLPNVMEAIASLKEKQGSTQKQIVEHIAHLLKKNKDGARNVTVQVRRALEHGLHSGLIKQRSGKYILGLDRRDYAIFRRFKQFNDPNPEYSSRRGRRRGRRGRRGRRRRSRRGRRGRRRPISNEDEMTDDTESGRSVTAGTPEPIDRSRRRRRRKRGRRRGRRGRRRTVRNEANSDSSDAGHKDSNSAIPPEKGRSEQEKIDYQSKPANHHQERNHQERNHEQEDEDVVDCGNPECLCNIKQEDDSPRCMSRENNYYNDSYLN